jgi:hypothetical protein
LETEFHSYILDMTRIKHNNKSKLSWQMLGHIIDDYQISPVILLQPRMDDR